jgi:hypothetical protein
MQNSSGRLTISFHASGRIEVGMELPLDPRYLVIKGYLSAGAGSLFGFHPSPFSLWLLEFALYAR